MSQCYVCGKDSIHKCERCKKSICLGCTITLTNQRLLTTKYFCSNCSERRFRFKQGVAIALFSIACLALTLALAALVIAVIVWQRSKFS
ncbi:MAG: hypothetical protein FK731_15385 [Asgard group archaeon]|nr:hypothetical protein [Asgard group archaeon]